MSTLGDNDQPSSGKKTKKGCCGRGGSGRREKHAKTRVKEKHYETEEGPTPLAC